MIGPFGDPEKGVSRSFVRPREEEIESYFTPERNVDVEALTLHQSSPWSIVSLTLSL